MDSKFSVARFVLELLAVVGWITVAIGLIVAAYLAMDGLSVEALLVSLGIVVSGLVQIAVAQIGLAQIVTAENSGETVELLRRIAKNGGVAHGSAASGSGSAPQMRAPAPSPSRAPGRAVGGNAVVHDPGEVGSVVKRYKGLPIVREPEGFSVDGDGVFPTVIAAEKFIDGKA